MTVRLRKGLFQRLTPPQIVALGFATAILAGSLLLSLPWATRPGEETTYLTALFTATSAVCVTGLVVVDTATHWSAFGHIVILSLIQIGGLGIMTMAAVLYILLGYRIGLRQRLLIREGLNVNDMAGVVRLARQIILFTLAIELSFAVILGLRWTLEFGFPKGAWFGLFHAVSAFNNAGFDLFGDFRSLTAYVADPTVSLSIAILIIIGGLGFPVILNVYQRRSFGALLLHAKLVLVTTVFLLALGTVLILALEHDHALAPLTPGAQLLAAFFQSVTPRTAGFNTVDLTSLNAATQFFIIILMFIGASPASTGGGIKTTTLAAIVLSVVASLQGKEAPEVFGRRIPHRQMMRALTLTVLAGILVITVTLLLTVTEQGKNFLSLLFETVSAFGTVGLSLGVTPDLSPAGRVLIILTMFIGRVGPLTAAYALAEKGRQGLLRMPEEKILVG